MYNIFSMSTDLPLQLNDLSPEPLHSQLSRQIRAMVLAGDLGVGAELPSIRALASRVRVSVITVQRAYESLEQEGLIYARRSQGFVVLGLPDRQRREIAIARLTALVGPAVRDSLAAGLTPDEVKAAVSSVLDDDLRERATKEGMTAK
jgi:GntR family transcriptional regulator